MRSALPCFLANRDTPGHILEVEPSATETYGLPYGHLIYFHFQKATGHLDNDVLHIRFSVKSVRVTGTNLGELVPKLSANTLEMLRLSSRAELGSPTPTKESKEPFIESIEIVEASVPKGKASK